jgi:hypothetical protein
MKNSLLSHRTLAQATEATAPNVGHIPSRTQNLDILRRKLPILGYKQAIGA